jgi:hypothetical protein
MDCLIDHIGIYGCGDSAPASGLYVNSLPGIELKGIDKVATAEQVNLSGVWDDVQQRASKRMSNDVVSAFKKRYKIKTVSQMIEIPKTIDADSTTASSAQYRGFIVELNQSGDLLVDSNLQVIYIQNLYLYLPSAVNTTIKIFDLDLGTTLKSSALTGAEGWNTVTILESYSARRIFVCYDATTVNSVELSVSDLGNAINNSIGGADINGATSTLASPTDYTEGNNTFGLRGQVSIRCSFEKIICNNLETFVNAWLYLLGVELMNETLYTSRLNNYSIGKEKAKELRMYFQAMYNGGIIDGSPFAGELNQAIEGITLDQLDCCIECNAPIRFVDAKL